MLVVLLFLPGPRRDPLVGLARHKAQVFDPALKPVGLYVEQGRELVRVSTASG